MTLPFENDTSRIVKRLAKQNMKANRRTSISIMVAILIASTFLCSLCTFVQSYWNQSVQQEIAAYGDWDAQLLEIHAGQLDLIQNNENVQTIMVKGDNQTALLPAASGLPYLLIQNCDGAYWGGMREKNLILRGRVPQAPGEIVVGKSFFEQNPSVEIGDRLNLDLGERRKGNTTVDFLSPIQSGEEFVKTGKVQYTIVGEIDMTVSSAYNGYPAYGWLDTTALSEDTGIVAYLQVTQPRKVYEIIPQIAEDIGLQPDEFGDYPFRYHTALLGMYGIYAPGHFLSSDLPKLALALGLVMAASMAVFAYIIRGAFSISAKRKVKELGILKSIGMTPRQIHMMIVYEARWLSVLPILVSVGLGYLFSYASYIYCDEETMYIARDQMKLLEGRLPQKEDEVVVSRYFLSNYAADAGIGEKVMLSSESFHGEYTVTGIMEGYKEKEVNGSSILLSKEALKGWSGYDPADYRAYVHFKNEQQMDETELTARSREIAKEYQLEMPIMNLSYMKFYKQPVNVSMLALVAGIAVLVIIGGYVVIQSIFRISINDKIQSYGQLRTIGTTPKQIRRIVKKEGRFLGWAGIGIGILLGCAAGFALFPRGFNLLFYAAAIVLTALLGWFMVSIAIRRPVKIAASISPIEAVRFTGNQSGKAHTHKKNMRLNPLSMGIANFRRDRKKTISIVASLSLGGVILLVTASILLVRSPERIARQYFPDGDYKIYIHSEKTEYEVMSKGNPLNEALRQEVLAVDGVTDVIENRQAVHVRFENEESSSGGMCDLLSDRNRDQMEAALVSGTLPQDSHSIALDMDYAEDMIGVDVGSVIKLTIGDQEIPVTVSGLLINDGLKNGHGPLALDSTCIVATKELFQEAMPMIDCFDYSWSIVSDPQKAEQIENSLSAIISSNPDLDLDTIGIHKDYEEMENRVVFGGLQALSWLVFLFGVVNLINTTLSNQMSRKRENSVFRAIGLTRKQLCQMTIYEGICYAFSAALATLAVGLPIAMIAARKFSEMTFHGAIMPYSFPFLQMGLFVLVLFGLEVILSFWTMRRQKNQSLVEEMRAME